MVDTTPPVLSTTALTTRLITLLNREFEGSVPRLESARPPKIGGLLIWEGFAGYPHYQRQRMLWEILEKQLSDEELRPITAILTLTPSEDENIRDNEEQPV